jgi:hypothetical protein
MKYIIVFSLFILGASVTAQEFSSHVSIDRGWFSPMGPFASDIPIIRFTHSVEYPFGKNTLSAYWNHNHRFNVKMWNDWVGLSYTRTVSDDFSFGVINHFNEGTEPEGRWYIVDFWAQKKHKTEFANYTWKGQLFWAEGLFGSLPDNGAIVKLSLNIEKEGKVLCLNHNTAFLWYEFFDYPSEIFGFYWENTLSVSYVPFGTTIYVQGNLPLYTNDGWGITGETEFVYNFGIRQNIK